MNGLGTSCSHEKGPPEERDCQCEDRELLRSDAGRSTRELVLADL